MCADRTLPTRDVAKPWKGHLAFTQVAAPSASRQVPHGDFWFAVTTSYDHGRLLFRRTDFFLDNGVGLSLFLLFVREEQSSETWPTLGLLCLDPVDGPVASLRRSRGGGRPGGSGEVSGRTEESRPVPLLERPSTNGREPRRVARRKRWRTGVPGRVEWRGGVGWDASAVSRARARPRADQGEGSQARGVRVRRGRQRQTNLSFRLYNQGESGGAGWGVRKRRRWAGKGPTLASGRVFEGVVVGGPGLIAEGEAGERSERRRFRGSP